jgi:hypothetical protein
MLILVFAFEISFAGIYVSFAPVVKVILSSVIGHIITSLVGCYGFGVPHCLVKRYVIKLIRQCEPVGWVMVGENCQSIKGHPFILDLMHIQYA